jgi:hypothetical protein
VRLPCGRPRFSVATTSTTTMTTMSIEPSVLLTKAVSLPQRQQCGVGRRHRQARGNDWEFVVGVVDNTGVHPPVHKAKQRSRCVDKERQRHSRHPHGALSDRLDAKRCSVQRIEKRCCHLCVGCAVSTRRYGGCVQAAERVNQREVVVQLGAKTLKPSRALERRQPNVQLGQHPRVRVR